VGDGEKGRVGDGEKGRVGEEEKGRVGEEGEWSILENDFLVFVEGMVFKSGHYF